jgi:2-keto-4-pentenoate hydratase/2-oxohepta-3-ene-1,7-dioic acid hydratase in catechol pathway
MKIICIGRNYSEHAKELGNEIPKEPLFFLKPDTAILPLRQPLVIPEFTNDLHYEVELVYKINRLGKYIAEEFASRYYTSVGIGIDFTARDLQEECKRKGLPWEKAKAFDGSAAISRTFLDLTNFESNDINFRLEKNGEIVQAGCNREMIFSPDKLIEHVSKFITLRTGDLLFTGTPSGVGQVVPGDRLEAFIGDKSLLKVEIR